MKSILYFAQRNQCGAILFEYCSKPVAYDEYSDQTGCRWLTSRKNCCATALLSNRLRFFENIEWCHTASSMPRPTNQQVVIELLDQLPLRKDGIKQLQQQGPQNRLRSNRATTPRTVQLAADLQSQGQIF